MRAMLVCTQPMKPRARWPLRFSRLGGRHRSPGATPVMRRGSAVASERCAPALGKRSGVQAAPAGRVQAPLSARHAALPGMYQELTRR